MLATGLQVRDWSRRINAAHDIAYTSDHALWIACGANVQSGRWEEVLLKRDIVIRTRSFTEREILAVSRYTDDHTIRAGLTLIADSFADRILVRPESASHCFVDDSHILSFAGVRFSKFTTLHEWY